MHHTHNRDTTEDLLTRGEPLPIDKHLPPGDRETAIRRRGLTYLISGTALMGVAFFSAATLVYIGGNATNAQRTFAGMALLSLQLTGAIYTAVGCGEWQQRPLRSMYRSLHDALHDAVAAIQSRQQRMAAAIDMIADSMPENQQLHHWRGFNSAVRQGFTAAEQTGTDGPTPPRARGAHLGVVKRNDHPR